MTPVTWVPLLRRQRALYDLPRGRERFEQYIRVMTGGVPGAIAFPLMAFNPMGQGHVADALDRLIGLDAESVAAETVADSTPRLPKLAPFRIGLVLVDDLGGGWTDRHADELEHRLDGRSLRKRGWAVALAWTSESGTASRDSVRRAVATALYRRAHVLRFGQAVTLGELMIQEGRALAFAGGSGPTLDPDDLEYSRAVIDPIRSSSDRSSLLVGLFGDVAARRLGHSPLGLSQNAGLELALAEALTSGVTPDEILDQEANR